jgi:hypothetical protein
MLTVEVKSTVFGSSILAGGVTVINKMLAKTVTVTSTYHYNRQKHLHTITV